MIKVLHIEPTTACNAACPQCAREQDPAFDKTKLDHLTLAQVQRHFTDDAIRGLDKMFMCGDYGDPAAGQHTLEIFRYFRQVNPDITLGMNTNGSLRNISWWQELAGLLNQERDYVIWSLDGLEDTNHIYRVNTIWSKIMENAEAFIRAGGRAHWEMLVYEHNEHQVKDCRDLARRMCFRWFRVKVSRRFDIYPVEFLKPPRSFTNSSLQGNISCQALNDNSRYLSAKGILHPCCWLGYDVTNTLDKFEEIQQSWQTTPHPVCQRTCATASKRSNFTDQWKSEEELC
jgi:MoaA/NifB/PqqE/SkfB family radical SAM enzyme